MPTYLDIPIYLLVLLIFSTLSYCIGHFSMCLYGENYQSKIDALFGKLFTGLIVLTMMYALIITSFLSFQLMTFCTLIFIFLIRKRRVERTHWFSFAELSSKYALVAIVCLFILFGIEVLAMLEIKTGLLAKDLYFDKFWYASVAEFFNLNHAETLNSSLLSYELQESKLSTYHYFELWPVAFVLFFLDNLNAPSVDFLVIQPFLLLLLFLGYLSLIKAFIGRLVWYHYLVSFGFLFSSCIYWSFLTEIENPLLTGYYFIYSNRSIPYFHAKRIVVELFLVAFLILAKKRQFLLGGSSLIILGAGSFASVAPTLAGTFVLGVLLWWKYKKPLRESLSLSALSVAVAIVVVVLLKIYVNSGLSFPFEYMLNKTSMAMMVQQIIGLGLQQLIAYLPMSIIVLIGMIMKRKTFLREEHFLMTVVFVIMTTTAMVIGGLFAEVNWKQLFTNSGYSLFKLSFTVFLFLLAERYWKNSKRTLFILTAAVFGMLFFRSIRNMQLYWKSASFPQTSSFLQETEKWASEIQDTDMPFLCAIYNDPKNFIDNVSSDGAGATFSNLNYLNLGTYLYYSQKYVDFTKLNWANIDPNVLNPFARANYQKSIIIKYLNSERGSKWKDATAIEQQLAFMKEYKVPVLLLPKNVIIPENFQPLIKKQLKDENTGQTFILMQYE